MKPDQERITYASFREWCDTTIKNLRLAEKRDSRDWKNSGEPSILEVGRMGSPQAQKIIQQTIRKLRSFKTKEGRDRANLLQDEIPYPEIDGLQGVGRYVTWNEAIRQLQKIRDEYRELEVKTLRLHVNTGLASAMLEVLRKNPNRQYEYADWLELFSDSHLKNLQDGNIRASISKAYNLLRLEHPELNLPKGKYVLVI